MPASGGSMRTVGAANGKDRKIAQAVASMVNPTGGSYKDIVRAAEKCTASCIHPGTPFNPNEKDVEKLIKRAEKFQ